MCVELANVGMDCNGSCAAPKPRTFYRRRYAKYWSGRVSINPSGVSRIRSVWYWLAGPNIVPQL